MPSYENMWINASYPHFKFSRFAQNMDKITIPLLNKHLVNVDKLLEWLQLKWNQCNLRSC